FAHLHDSGSVALGGQDGVLSVDEPVFLGHRCSLAKYAAAFFRNAFSISSSRTRRSSSRTRSSSGISDVRGCTESFFRYALTQNPSVVSLILSSRATSVIVRGGEESTTFLTACSLNSGVYCFDFPGSRSRSFPDKNPIGSLSGNGGAPHSARAVSTWRHRGSPAGACRPDTGAR